MSEFWETAFLPFQCSGIIEYYNTLQSCVLEKFGGIWGHPLGFDKLNFLVLHIMVTKIKYTVLKDILNIECR